MELKVSLENSNIRGRILTILTEAATSSFTLNWNENAIALLEQDLQNSREGVYVHTRTCMHTRGRSRESGLWEIQGQLHQRDNTSYNAWNKSDLLCHFALNHLLCRDWIIGGNLSTLTASANDTVFVGFTFCFCFGLVWFPRTIKCGRH